MGDQLEKFIMENREAFDGSAPGEGAWKSIDRRLNKKHSNWPAVWKIAAMLFMASTIYLMIDRSQQETSEGPFLSEEFTQAENYYVSLIAQRRQAVIEQLSPEQQKEFLTEIDHLDAMYSELKKTYQTNAFDDRIPDAMINNLQLRLDILNKQLDILQHIKNQNDENDISIISIEI